MWEILTNALVRSLMMIHQASPEKDDDISRKIIDDFLIRRWVTSINVIQYTFRTNRSITHSNHFLPIASQKTRWFSSTNDYANINESEQGKETGRRRDFSFERLSTCVLPLPSIVSPEDCMQRYLLVRSLSISKQSMSHICLWYSIIINSH